MFVNDVYCELEYGSTPEWTSSNSMRVVRPGTTMAGVDHLPLELVA